MTRLIHVVYVMAFVVMLCVPGLAAHRLSPSNPCHARNLFKANNVLRRMHACRESFNHTFIVGPDIHTARLRWMYRLFGVSSLQEVLAGKEDWLYLDGGGDINRRPNSRSIAREPFGPGEKEAWVENLAAWRAYLEARGIRFLFMLAPDKHTIYPEYLPWQLQVQRPSFSRVDSLMEALRADARTHGLTVLDPKQALLQAKADAELFYRADTHWNLRGAFAAYEKTVRTMQPWYPQIVPLDGAQFVMHCEASSHGDLARMLKLNHKDQFRRCELVLPDSFYRDHDHPIINQTAWNATAPGAHLDGRPIRNLLLYGDSFSFNLLPFLLSHASKARLLRGAGLIDTDDLELQQPDLVIIELVERHLYADPTPPPKPARGFSFGEGFFQEPVNIPLDERWMTHDAVLRINPAYAQKYRSLALSFRIPASVAASGPVTYALGNQPPQPVPPTAIGGYVEIANRDWLLEDGSYTIHLRGAGAMVPALACGRAHDLRELTAAVKVTWLE